MPISFNPILLSKQDAQNEWISISYLLCNTIYQEENCLKSRLLSLTILPAEMFDTFASIFRASIFSTIYITTKFKEQWDEAGMIKKGFLIAGFILLTPVGIVASSINIVLQIIVQLGHLAKSIGLTIIGLSVPQSTCFFILANLNVSSSETSDDTTNSNVAEHDSSLDESRLSKTLEKLKFSPVNSEDGSTAQYTKVVKTKKGSGKYIIKFEKISQELQRDFNSFSLRLIRGKQTKNFNRDQVVHDGHNGILPLIFEGKINEIETLMNNIKIKDRIDDQDSFNPYSKILNLLPPAFIKHFLDLLVDEIKKDIESIKDKPSPELINYCMDAIRYFYRFMPTIQFTDWIDIDQYETDLKNAIKTKSNEFETI